LLISDQQHETHAHQGLEGNIDSVVDFVDDFATNGGTGLNGLGVSQEKEQKCSPTTGADDGDDQLLILDQQHETYAHQSLEGDIDSAVDHVDVFAPPGGTPDECQVVPLTSLSIESTEIAHADQQIKSLRHPLIVTPSLALPLTQVPTVSPLPIDPLPAADAPSVNSPPEFKFKKGDRVKFYDKSTDEWKQGEILDIELLDGYFANATVRYRGYDFGKKQVVPKTIKIFADSWLQKS